MRTRGIYSPIPFIALMLFGTPAVQPQTDQIMQALQELRAQVETLTTALGDAQQTIQTLQQQVEQLTQFMRVEQSDLNGMKGPHLIIEGANLHIRSGSGATDEDGNLIGLGNVVIGYNELPLTLNPGDRDGSHNLIIGREHRYQNFGGLVAGFNNTVSGPEASVSGGRLTRPAGELRVLAAGVSIRPWILARASVAALTTLPVGVMLVSVEDNATRHPALPLVLVVASRIPPKPSPPM